MDSYYCPNASYLPCFIKIHKKKVMKSMVLLRILMCFYNLTLLRATYAKHSSLVHKHSKYYCIELHREQRSQNICIIL